MAHYIYVSYTLIYYGTLYLRVIHSHLLWHTIFTSHTLSFIIAHYLYVWYTLIYYYTLSLSVIHSYLLLSFTCHSLSFIIILSLYVSNTLIYHYKLSLHVIHSYLSYYTHFVYHAFSFIIVVACVRSYVNKLTFKLTWKKKMHKNRSMYDETSTGVKYSGEIISTILKIIITPNQMDSFMKNYCTWNDFPVLCFSSETALNWIKERPWPAVNWQGNVPTEKPRFPITRSWISS